MPNARVSKIALVGDSKRMTVIWYSFPFALVAALGSGYLKLDPQYVTPFWEFIQWAIITFLGGESLRSGLVEAFGKAKNGGPNGKSADPVA